MTFVDGVFLASNSEVQTFKDCPRRWWLGWHRALKPRATTTSDARSTGTRIHVALASHYDPEQTTGALTALRVAQQRDAIQTGLDEPRDDEDHFRWSQEVLKLHSVFDLERAMIEGYIDWLEETGVDQTFEVVAAETYVESPLLKMYGAQVRYIGKLDAKILYPETGRRGFIDHKTVQSLTDATLGINQQMLHYHLIDWMQPGDPLERATGALYNMLRKVKRTDKARPPFYGRVAIDHNQHEVANYRRQLDRTIGQIVQASLFLSTGPGQPSQDLVPSRPSRDCVWKCDFFKICRMFDDGSRVEDAVQDMYVRHDPLDYYGDRIEREVE